jgi:transglutaminase-like putative cysteine protease
MSHAAASAHELPSAAHERAGHQPASVLSKYFEASLYLLLYTSVLTLVSTGKLDIFTTVAAPAVLVWKGFRRWRGRGPELSPRAATICVVLYFVVIPFDFLWARNRASDAPNPALYAALLTTVHLLLFVMMARLYSGRSRRDSLFLAMLAFASMLAAAVLTVDTTYLVFFLVFIALGISTFVGLEVERGSEGASSTPLNSDGLPARRIVRALSLTSGIVALAALVLGGLIFFLLPRFTAGYFGSYSLRPRLMSGFTESVQLGQIGEIQKSSEVVMRVKVEGGPDRFLNQHWRGIALTHFDGWRWSGTTYDRRRVFLDENGWFIMPNGRDNISRDPLRYKILLEPVASDAIFVASNTSVVRGRFSAGSGLGESQRRNYLLVDSTGSIFNPFPNYSQLSYEANSAPLFLNLSALRSAGTAYPENIRATFLQTPDLDPRVWALALQATAGATNPYDRAVALESYLRTHFGYTLDLGSTPTRDPLANFLFVRRAGHCEYFATAMTVMLRTLGIPARYINGFQTGEYNSVGGDFIVRASDAHSWVEVYFPGQGWITFDPTPAGDSASQGWFSGVAKYVDWFQLQWGEWVINYDFLHQMTLAQGVKQTSRQWVTGVREKFAHFYGATVAGMRGWQVRAANSPLIQFAVAAVFAGFFFLLGGKRLRGFFGRVWLLQASGTGPLSPQRASAHYQEMLRVLARRGYHKAEAITPLEFASTIRQVDLAAPVGRLTEIYQAARFGDAEIETRQSVDLLREIRQRLAIVPRMS